MKRWIAALAIVVWCYGISIEARGNLSDQTGNESLVIHMGTEDVPCVMKNVHNTLITGCIGDKHGSVAFYNCENITIKDLCMGLPEDARDRTLILTVKNSRIRIVGTTYPFDTLVIRSYQSSVVFESLPAKIIVLETAINSSVYISNATSDTARIAVQLMADAHLTTAGTGPFVIHKLASILYITRAVIDPSCSTRISRELLEKLRRIIR